ncbi:hypothetical protein HOM50_00635 [bacterium]|jgi:hypothetical protein|nr:hypothetical protein [bacterium]MBT5014897.1 hypothetical protein [bacterium]
MRYPPQPIPLISNITPDKYWAQPKFDGWRVVRENGEFFTRHGNKLPQDILTSMLTNTTEYDLDLELVSTEGRRKIPTILAGSDTHSGQLILLDVMIPDMPIEQRMKIAATIAKQEGIMLAPLQKALSWTNTNKLVRKAFDHTYGIVCDGIVLKEKTSLYPTSNLGQICFSKWVKLKSYYDE